MKTLPSPDVSQIPGRCLQHFLHCQILLLFLGDHPFTLLPQLQGFLSCLTAADIRFGNNTSASLAQSSLLKEKLGFFTYNFKMSVTDYCPPWTIFFILPVNSRCGTFGVECWAKL